MFKQIVCAVAVAFAIGEAPAGASTISLTLTSPVVVGSSFGVDVLVDNLFDGRSATDTLVAFGFDVAVGDTSILQYVDATEGPLFDPLLLSPATPMVVGFATSLLGIGPLDVAGPLRLATLRFNALAAGQTTINVLGNSFPDTGLVYAELPFGALSGSARIQADAPVPEPASLILLGTGAAGLLLRRRARRAT